MEMEDYLKDPNPHIGLDKLKAERLKAAGHTLCERCEGTGNQMYSMYQKCEKCNGCGIARKEKP